MKFKPKNHRENLTKLKELSAKLHAMIEDGSFYDLSYITRHREIRKVKGLYNKLRGPVSDVHLQQAVSFATVLMLITGAKCGSDSSGNDYARVTIDLGLRNNKAVEATKGPAPSNVTGISLVVTGPGMDDINESIPAEDGEITLKVPAGDDRVFSVRADTATMDYYTGSATEDLEAGENADVEIAMALQKFAPSFVKRAENPFGMQSMSSMLYPSFVDIDNDGDLDLFLSSRYGDIYFLENQAGPTFASPISEPFGLQYSYPYFPGPMTFVDIDNDGDLDVYSGGNYSGSPYNLSTTIIKFINNQTGSTPDFSSGPELAIPTQFPLDGSVLPNFDDVKLSFVDIDNDGNIDVFFGGKYYGENSDSIQYLKNIGTPRAPLFDSPQLSPYGLTAITSAQIPTLTHVNDISLAFADIDGDGDQDLFAGVSWYSISPIYSVNDILFFENTGSANAPSFAAPLINPFGLSRISGFTAYPILADIDKDGDLDLFAPDYNGNIQYFENRALSTPDTTPPANVTELIGSPSSGNAVLTWINPSDSDFSKVSITFTPEAAGVTQPIEVPKGTEEAFIGSFSYGGIYTFTVRSVDDLGNQSSGESVSVEIMF